MSDKPINTDRRRLLAVTTTAIAGAGISAAASPFVLSWNPSAKARAVGADVEVDVGKLLPGQIIIAEWRGMPVLILRRSQEMLDDLRAMDERVKDPNSEHDSQQPEYAKNPHRSINPEYLVVMGVCTHLGCSPHFKPEHGIAEVGEWWKGGFYCPCHQSSYDLAGRVFKGNSPAPLNLPVPPHKFVSSTRIQIGDAAQT